MLQGFLQYIRRSTFQYNMKPIMWPWKKYLLITNSKAYHSKKKVIKGWNTIHMKQTVVHGPPLLAVCF